MINEDNNKELVNKSKLKFCVCFFGVISRSIDLTIKSINENIFNVLADKKIKTDVYVHNMKVKKFKSIRSNENTIIEDKIDLLNSINCNKIFYSETKQSEFDKNFNWKNSIKFGYLENNYNSHQNAIRQLFSVKQVTKMWENKDINYDYYIYLRPDLLYINKLNIEKIFDTLLYSNFLGTPFWHKWGGLNDRIYMGCEKIMSIIGNRFDYLEEYINEKKIYHPETYFKYIVLKNNIKYIDINLRGKRTRSNGHIVNENFRL